MDFFKGRLQAAEGSHFKTEQEEQLKDYRRRRLKEGALKDEGLLPYTEEELARHGVGSGATVEKLAEIYAQEARLAPQDVERRRVSSQMPPMEGKGRRSAAGSTGALGLAVPRTSLGRQRWALPIEDDRPLLVEETAAMVKNRELAQRAMAAGTRALLFGTALAVVGVVVGGQLAAEYYGIRTAEDLRGAVQTTLGPSAAYLKEYSKETKVWIDGKLGKPSGGGAAGVAGGNPIMDPVSEAARGFGDELRRTKAMRGMLGGTGVLAPEFSTSSLRR